MSATAHARYVTFQRWRAKHWIEAYGVIAAAFFLGFPYRIGFAITWPIVLAMADELLPFLILDQHLDIDNALWKVFGIGLGLSIGLTVTRRSTGSPDTIHRSGGEKEKRAP